MVSSGEMTCRQICGGWGLQMNHHKTMKTTWWFRHPKGHLHMMDTCSAWESWESWFTALMTKLFYWLETTMAFTMAFTMDLWNLVGARSQRFCLRLATISGPKRLGPQEILSWKPLGWRWDRSFGCDRLVPMGRSSWGFSGFSDGTWSCWISWRPCAKVLENHCAVSGDPDQILQQW